MCWRFCCCYEDPPGDKPRGMGWRRELDPELYLPFQTRASQLTMLANKKENFHVRQVLTQRGASLTCPECGPDSVSWIYFKNQCVHLIFILRNQSLHRPIEIADESNVGSCVSKYFEVLTAFSSLTRTNYINVGPFGVFWNLIWKLDLMRMRFVTCSAELYHRFVNTFSVQNTLTNHHFQSVFQSYIVI